MKNKGHKVKRMVRFSTALDFKLTILIGQKNTNVIGWMASSVGINLKPFLVFPENKTVPIEISIPAKHDISNDSNVEKPKS